MFTRNRQLPINNTITDDADLFTLIREHDVRQVHPVDQIRHIRAEARLEQIITSPNAPASSGKKHLRNQPLTAPKRNLKWAIRAAAIPVAAAAIIAAATLLPGGVGPQPAFATWTATPRAIDADALSAAMGACQQRFLALSFGIEPRQRREMDVLRNMPPAITEQRGEWLVLGYHTDAIDFAGCLVRMVGARAVVQYDWMNSGSVSRSGQLGAWDPVTREWPSSGFSLGTSGISRPELPAAGIGDFQFANFMVQNEGHMNTLWAMVGSDVVAVSIDVPNGQSVQATVTGGHAVAWWPAAESVDEREMDTLKWLAAAISGVTLTLSDGTVIETDLPHIADWRGPVSD